MTDRNISVANTDASKDKADHSELAQEVSQDSFVHPVKSKHVAIGNEPHPHAEAQKETMGIPQDQNIEIVDWEGPNDPENPFNWSKKYKWLVTITTCWISILTGLPAGAYGAASTQMSHEWDIDETKFPYLTFALVTWNMGAAIFPLLFVPLTENTGRLPGYFGAYVLFCIWLIPSALSPNFATILVTRFFGGGASSVAINLVGGTITDIWKGDRERSIPLSIFGMTGVVGIALGPLVGGAIQSGLHWRWIYWIQLIVDAGFLPLFYLILKETRGDVILSKKAHKLRKAGKPNAYAKSELEKTGVIQNLKISFLRPTKMLTTEFVVIGFTLWVSFAWGILFLFQSSVPQVYKFLYGFSTFKVDLVQLAISIGAIIATLINPLQDMLYFNSSARNLERPGKPIPEARLYFAVPGSLIFSAGMFWFGWSSFPDTHWIVPTLGIGCVGVGIFSIYMSTINYLADAYEKYAASALTAASLGRNTFGAFLPLATPALYRNLGFQWASSLVGFVALGLTVVPVLLLLVGEKLRAKSPFMLDATWDESESVERRESLNHMREGEARRVSSILPWSHVRAGTG